MVFNMFIGVIFLDYLLLAGILSGIIFFALHVTVSSSFPKPLSAQEERICFEKMKKGEKDAKNRLIEHNLRLVAHIIKKYYSNNSDQEDLISIGTIGLIKAVSTFDYEKGTRFATYAARCIENEILMYFRSRKKLSREISFSDPIESDRDGNELSVIDILADENNISEEIERKLRAEKLYKTIEKELLPREKEIICLRYGLFGRREHTQRETAKILGISRSYVSRIEKKALFVLKNNIDK